jgi:hypothetical protein
MATSSPESSTAAALLERAQAVFSFDGKSFVRQQEIS